MGAVGLCAELPFRISAHGIYPAVPWGSAPRCTPGCDHAQVAGDALPQSSLEAADVDLKWLDADLLFKTQTVTKLYAIAGLRDVFCSRPQAKHRMQSEAAGALCNLIGPLQLPPLHVPLSALQEPFELKLTLPEIIGLLPGVVLCVW